MKHTGYAISGNTYTFLGCLALLLGITPARSIQVSLSFFFLKGNLFLATSNVFNNLMASLIFIYRKEILIAIVVQIPRLQDPIWVNCLKKVVVKSYSEFLQDPILSL